MCRRDYRITETIEHTRAELILMPYDFNLKVEVATMEIGLSAADEECTTSISMIINAGHPYRYPYMYCKWHPLQTPSSRAELATILAPPTEGQEPFSCFTGEPAFHHRTSSVPEDLPMG
jgi:hypothetical protein